MTFTLEDKGELDTRIVCDGCEETLRFNFNGDIELSPEEIEAEYLAWVEGLIEGAEAAHKCSSQEG